MRSFIAIIAVGILTLSQSAFALPEPVGGRVSPNDKHAGLMKRATNCGMNEHDESMCPEGAECNCAIQNPCLGWLCEPNFFYYCVVEGCTGCDCEER